jgi:hypothetical protein
MVVSIPPKIGVVRFIGQVKAVASTKFNKSGLGDTPYSGRKSTGFFPLTQSVCQISLHT